MRNQKNLLLAVLCALLLMVMLGCQNESTPAGDQAPVESAGPGKTKTQ
jgi:hypothetical protein